MPYARPRQYPRKYSSKRTTKRYFKRKFSRRYNKRGQRIYRFVRYTSGLGTFIANNILASYGGYNFSLNDLPNVTEFTSLFDMYKINAIKISFIPQMTENISATSANNPYANTRFFSAIDYNDSSTPTTIDELRQYSTCKYTPILKTHTRMIYKPKILDSSSYSVSPWMSTASPSANYFGLKVGVEPTQSTVTTSFEYKIEAKFYMSFKNVV